MKPTFLAAAAAVLIALVVASPAAARGYSCNYAKSGVTVTVDGYDNNSYFCRLFNAPFGGRRIHDRTGRTYCAWLSRKADLRVSVSARSPSYGRLFCVILAGRIPAGWIRTR